ncbi:MAG: GntR family transcriptional regulator [Eubacterium sp.]|nr:GntR family transcriptional regulator [Eubacterium sp.]
MFRLDERSHKAMYEQVMDNLKELIMTNVMKENDKVPSVRELSEQLMINPNTVQKAYKELEREGYIYTVSGKGSFVSGKSEIKRDPEKVKALLNNVGDSFRGLLMLGYSPEDAASLVQGTVMESLDSAKKKL